MARSDVALPKPDLDGEGGSGTRSKDEVKRELGLTHRPPGLKDVPRAAGVPAELRARADSGIDIEVDAPDEPADEPSITSGRPSLPPALPPVAKIGRYGLLGRLAVGGMADIYLAEENMAAGEKRYAVIKLVKPILADESEFDDMFVREGRVAMRLGHPNICHVYQFGRIEDRFFIAMEYVDGVTMREIMRRAAKRSVEIPVAVIVHVIARVAEALDFAHRLKDAKGRELGVVHRDVSPHNMMVSYQGVVKLLDFGVVKDRTEAPAGESGTVKGKFAYMAPEQCSGGAVDGRSDVFALGICLFEALTGRLLYKRATQYDTFKAIIEDPPPSVLTLKPSLPAALDVIVRKALAKKPANRYQSAGEMQEALEKFMLDARETVNAARIARVLGPLFADDVLAGPQLERSEEVVERLARFSSLNPTALDDSDLMEVSPSDTPPPSARRAPVAAPAVAPPPPRARRPWLVPAIAGALLAAVVVAAIMMLTGGDDAPAAPDVPAHAVTPAVQPVVEPAPTGPAEPEQAQPESADGEQVTADELRGADDPTEERGRRGDRSGRDRRDRSMTAEMRTTMARVGGARSPGFVTDPGF